MEISGFLVKNRTVIGGIQISDKIRDMLARNFHQPQKDSHNEHRWSVYFAADSVSVKLDLVHLKKGTPKILIQTFNINIEKCHVLVSIQKYSKKI